MNEAKGGSSKRRKALSATLAIAMALTMLLSGTLAYFYQSKATNVFKHEFKEAYGHDDFIEGTNKDVYVENTGNTNIYVRVKLEETFTLNGTTLVNKKWHKPDNTPGADVTVGTETGDTAATDQDIHHYFTWKMGTGETKAFLSALSPDYGTGKKKIEDKVAKDSSGDTYTDDTPDSNKDFKVTTAACDGVITMADYQNPKDTGGTALTEEAKTTWQKEFDGWVMDTDGWIYWSQPVTPQHATGLLLTNVEVSDELARKSYEYDIDVTFQAVDNTDLQIWTKGIEIDEDGNVVGAQSATANAKAMLTLMMGQDDTSEVARLQRKYDNLQSEGAKIIYKQLIKEASGEAGVNSNPMLREQLADAADLRYQSDTTTYDQTLIKINRSAKEVETPTEGLPYSMALHMMNAVKGSDASEMSKDEAQAITSFSLGTNEEIQTMPAALTYENFPSLIKLHWSNYFNPTDGQFRISDNSLAAQIECLVITGSNTLTTVDISNMPNLVWLECGDNANLTTITTKDGKYPSGIEQVYFCGCSQVPAIDYSDAALSKLPVLGINDNFMQEPENVAALKSNKYLQFLRVGKGVTTETLDLSGVDELFRIDVFSPNIKKIVLSEKAFSHGATYTTKYYYGANLNIGLNLNGALGLEYLDISVCTAYKNSANLKNCTKLIGVTRRADQAEFAEYPAGHKVYERVIDGSQVTYYEHNGDTKSEPMNQTAVLEASGKASIAALFGDE